MQYLMKVLILLLLFYFTKVNETDGGEVTCDNPYIPEDVVALNGLQSVIKKSNLQCNNYSTYCDRYGPPLYIAALWCRFVMVRILCEHISGSSTIMLRTLRALRCLIWNR